jgi:hypothetical protein
MELKNMELKKDKKAVDGQIHEAERMLSRVSLEQVTDGFNTEELVNTWSIVFHTVAEFQVFIIFNSLGLALTWVIKECDFGPEEPNWDDGPSFKPKEILEVLENFIIESQRAPKVIYVRKPELASSEEFREFIDSNNIKLLENEKIIRHFESNSKSCFLVLSERYLVKRFFTPENIVDQEAMDGFLRDLRESDANVKFNVLQSVLATGSRLDLSTFFSSRD